MTAGQRTNNTGDTVAATGFMAFLALMAGGAGLLIAAFAVATERAWSGRRGTAPARQQLRQARAADHRAWLARDAADQAAWRQARRDWWESGGDPATKPAAPSAARRVGAGAYRAWARLAVLGGDFRDGWRDGWRAADEVRRNGGRVKDIASARPTSRDQHSGGQETAVPDGTPAGSRDNASGSEWPRTEPTDCPVHHTPRVWMDLGDGVATGHCEACDTDASTRNPWKTCVPTGGPDHKCPNCGSTLVLPTIMCRICNLSVRWCCGAVIADNQPCPTCQKYLPSDNNQTTTEDTSMTTPTNTAAAPQADSNAAVMAAHLDTINAGNQQVSDLVDQLAALRNQQEARIRQATEFAESTGQTAQTRTAMDAATELAAQLGQHLGAFSDAANTAAEETNAARDGLTPVIHAADTLSQAGADGRAVAPATNA